MSEILTQEGFEVFNALDGEIGVQMAREKKPDIILLDLILPKKDGFEVLKELKADPNTKEIPVVVLTNLEGMEDINKVLELGATTYLVKANYEIEDIAKKIKEIIENNK